MANSNWIQRNKYRTAMSSLSWCLEQQQNLPLDHSLGVLCHTCPHPGLVRLILFTCFCRIFFIHLFFTWGWGLLLFCLSFLFVVVALFLFFCCSCFFFFFVRVCGFFFFFFFFFLFCSFSFHWKIWETSMWIKQLRVFTKAEARVKIC